MGAAVTSGVGSAVAGAVLGTAAELADGAVLGAVDAVGVLQAVARMATIPATASNARGPDRVWDIAIDSSL